MTSPVQMTNSNNGGVSIQMTANRLEGGSFGQKAKREDKLDLETLDVDMVIKSIGYTSEQLDHSVNFDHHNKVIKNDYGCV